MPRFLGLYVLLVIATGQVARAKPLTAEPRMATGLPPSLIDALRTYLIAQGDAYAQISPGGRFWATKIPGSYLILVYAEDDLFCGSGGCSLQVLRRTGTSFQDIGKGEVIFAPITMLPTRHHGLPDLGVICRDWHEWQGAARYDGKNYHAKCDIHVQADTVHPKGRLLLTDATEGLSIYRHPPPLKPGFTCMRKVPGQGYPTGPLFGIRMPFCPESMFKGPQAPK